MSKKQSSVDWLFSQLWETPKDKYTWFGLLIKAKEKHEQDVIDAYIEASPRFGDITKEAAQQYYNETFKQ